MLSLVVIKLEGGADSDLAVLDCPPTPPPERRRSSSNPLMSPHGDDMADLSAEVKREGTVSTEPTASQTGKPDNKNGNYILLLHVHSGFVWIMETWSHGKFLEFHFPGLKSHGVQV